MVEGVQQGPVLVGTFFSKPRWGHPLVEFVIVCKLGRKTVVPVARLRNSCMFVHSHTH